MAFVFAAAAGPLWAHAILLQSKPAANSTVKGPDVPLWLRFNVRVDGKRSRLTLVTPGGSTVAVPVEKQSAPDTLDSEMKNLKPGAYKLQWRVLASDGHMSSGEVEFTVT